MSIHGLVPVVLAGVALAASSAEASTYRVLSYNAQGLAQIATGLEYDYGRTHESRGRDIGQRIQAGRWDVVTFQEIQSDGMREGIFSQVTRAVYPTQVRQLDDGDLGHEDSGLMLISRFALLPMTNVRPAECKRPGPRAGQCLVAFTEYDDCSGSDCLADKGIGLVRLANTRTGRPLNVLFTHMQAHDDASSLASRGSQFTEIRAFADRWIPRATTPGQDTMLVGDLNVPSRSREWELRIGPGSPMGAAGFVDLWTAEHPATEREVTFSRRNIRASHSTVGRTLDYVLLRRSDAATSCVTAQRIPWRTFRDASLADLSDHYPFEVTISGTVTPHCDPARAVRVLDSSEHTLGTTEPGGSLWFLIDQPGTWTATADAPLVALGARDLTTPLENLGRSAPPGRSTTFHVREGFAVHVRVIPASAAPVTTRFHKHDASSPADPVHLVTGRLATTRFEDGAGASTQYFHIRARRPSVPTRQRIRILAARNFGATSAVRLRLRLLTPTGGELAATAFGSAATLDTRLPTGGGDFIVELARDAPAGAVVNLLYQTELRAIRLLRLRCTEQEDSTGDDEIKIRLATDGGLRRDIALGSFDTDQARSLLRRYGATGLLHFTRRIDARLTERDSPDPDDNLGSATIPRPASSPDPIGSVGSVRFTGDDADYRLFFEHVPLP